MTGKRRNVVSREALRWTQLRIRELTQKEVAARREIAELRQFVAEQAEYLDALAAKVELMSSRDDDLQAMLVDAYDQLLHRVDAVRVTTVMEQQNVREHSNVIRGGDTGFVPNRHLVSQQISKYLGYRQLVHQIQEAVRSAVPPGSTVVVVSKGDEELLKLGDRQGWHFPQDEEGVYAGYHPADSAEAIEHLEELRAKGAEFLLFPGTAFWWLEHYEEFEQYLEERYHCVWSDERCIIYRLFELHLGR
jgi:hypothetical protein